MKPSAAANECPGSCSIVDDLFNRALVDIYRSAAVPRGPDTLDEINHIIVDK